MLLMHESSSLAPFDTYGLHLFRLVAQTGSFTRAGRLAGLTQSAITRQIQGIESRLGVTLLERTTRRVEPTAAGRFAVRVRPILSHPGLERAFTAAWQAVEWADLVGSEFGWRVLDRTELRA